MQAPTGLTLEGLCERLNGGWAGSTVSLGDATVSAPAPSRVRSLTRRGSAPNAPGHAIRLSKRKRTFENRLRVWTVAEPPAHAAIHAVTAVSITICNGCVSLPSEGYWVFTSPQAMLQDMRVTGALPMHGDTRMCPTAQSSRALLHMAWCMRAHRAHNVAALAPCLPAVNCSAATDGISVARAVHVQEQQSGTPAE